MIKESLQNGLGTALKTERKKQCRSQADIAAHAELSIPVIRNLEQGMGSLLSFWRVLDALQLELEGRNLPAGNGMGCRIACLRTKRGLSQRALAVLTGVSPPTITALETTRQGRLQTLERVLMVLGAGCYLLPKGTRKPFYGHAGQSSVSLSWQTPQSLLTRLYSIFGTFDLDPCSPHKNPARAPVRANMYFTEEDDGLSLSWFGHVFMNPPYGRQIGQWVKKAETEVSTGKAMSVVALLPARTDTKWWHQHIAGKANIFLLQGRLKFGNYDESAPFPSALVLWGADTNLIQEMQAEFSESWFIPSK